MYNNKALFVKSADIAGWSSPVARRAHNPKVGGSNPPPATIGKPYYLRIVRFFYVKVSLLSTTAKSTVDLTMYETVIKEADGKLVVAAAGWLCCGEYKWV